MNTPPTSVDTYRKNQYIAIGLLIIALVGLPMAVWLDIQNLTEAILANQANDLNSMISNIRRYYSTNVVARVLTDHGTPTQVLHNYEAIPGAIPIPATLSLELGKVIAEKESAISYRFISDYPFSGRVAHPFDEFERTSLAALRQNQDPTPITQIRLAGVNSQIRLIAPIIMSAACVSCHNTHPDSTKRDWKVGDVRGIQEITVSQPIARNLWSFKFSLLYFLLIASTGAAFILMQRRQFGQIQSVNQKLQSTNQFLADISEKISHYLAPQIYHRIFSGAMGAEIQTQRKKLTIFFSDIKNFTSITEEMQPEEMTRLLNEYFTEMAAITLKYGGTIDKFIGDAILIFFGDPNTLGTELDAKACVNMAIDMQTRLAELNVRWRKQGIEMPFQVRMGINTGFCSVGNFGSRDRMDYTLLGAEVNLTARLQSIAQPGGIVVSFETYALVNNIVAAEALEPVSMKGIAREVVPYAILGRLADDGTTLPIFSQQAQGMDIFLDLSRIDAAGTQAAQTILKKALDALEQPGR